MIINKYNNFILERKLELFFESKIYISNDLSSLLKSKEMSDDIISRIISSYSKLVDTDTKVNFIDITDENDRLSFINDDKGMKLYHDGEDVYRSTSRNEVKIGKIIKKILTSYKNSDISKSTKNVIDLITDKDIEEFVNLYKSSYDIEMGKMGRFELVEGEDVKKYYLEENYYRVDGILGNSCMRYNSCQDYIEFYVKNNVKLLVLFADDDKEKISGRAIIWDVSMDDITGKTFMDRVYTVNDSDTKLFLKYARENKWWYKSSQDSDEDTTLYSPDDNYVTDDTYHIIAEVKKGKHKYPYMDTLKFFNYKEGHLSNVESDNSDIELISVDGGYECSCDGTGKQDCYSCVGSGEHYCHGCDGSGEHYCHGCDGSGHQDCSECDGDGEISCSECDGDGCEHCDGSGHQDCSECDGSGKEECPDCDGSGHQDCSECDGSGEETCPECDGEGEETCVDCEDYTNY